jgi:hypothetical protein
MASSTAEHLLHFYRDDSDFFVCLFCNEIVKKRLKYGCNICFLLLDLFELTLNYQGPY